MESKQRRLRLALNYYIFPPQESIHLQLSSFPSLQEEDKSRKDDSEKEKEKDKNRDKPSEKSKIRMLSKGELEHHFITLLNWGTSTAGRHCKLNTSFHPQAFCTYFPEWSCMCKRKEKKKGKKNLIVFWVFCPCSLICVARDVIFSITSFFEFTFESPVLRDKRREKGKSNLLLHSGSLTTDLD